MTVASPRIQVSESWAMIRVDWRRGSNANTRIALKNSLSREALGSTAVCFSCDELINQIAPVPTRSGPQATNPGYPGLSQFIWWYPWSTTDIKSYPIFRWTMEVQQGVTRPAAAARQPGAEMNDTYGMSTSKGISQDNSVLNFYPDLSRVMQVWLLFPNLSLDMQV